MRDNGLMGSQVPQLEPLYKSGWPVCSLQDCAKSHVSFTLANQLIPQNDQTAVVKKFTSPSAHCCARALHPPLHTRPNWLASCQPTECHLQLRQVVGCHPQSPTRLLQDLQDAVIQLDPRMQSSWMLFPSSVPKLLQLLLS